MTKRARVSGRSKKVTKEACLQHPTIEAYQIKKKSTHTYSTEKKIDGQIKKTAKIVTDSTLPCYGAMVGKHTSVWPFKVSASCRCSRHRQQRILGRSENRKTFFAL